MPSGEIAENATDGIGNKRGKYSSVTVLNCAFCPESAVIPKLSVKLCIGGLTGLRNDSVAIELRAAPFLGVILMNQSMQLRLASPDFSGLLNEKPRESSQCCAGRLGSKIPICLLVVGKKNSVDKEDAVSFARSTRALPMRLVTVRKGLDSGVQSVVDTYVGKVKRYCSFEELQIRPNPKNTSDVSAQVEAEGERVIKSITAKDWVVLVDERGQDFTSEQFAASIADAGDTGASALVFCIGGPYGHGSQVRKRANVSIKLSSMVLNHQVAMIVLLEQIYRAWTILRGEKYHH